MIDPARIKARTAEELLDLRAAAARERMMTSVQRFADDLCEATDLPGRIRRHPVAAMALGATLGALGGPALIRRLAASPVPTAALAMLVKSITQR